MNHKQIVIEIIMANSNHHRQNEMGSDEMSSRNIVYDWQGEWFRLSTKQLLLYNVNRFVMMSRNDEAVR